MDEKELKTSPRQRIFISIIAVIMLGSVIASYVAIVLGGSKSSSTSEIDEEMVEKYIAAYNEELQSFAELTSSDFNKLTEHMSEVVAYDENAINEGDLRWRDLLVGDGRELTEGDTNYLAFYVGWCADGSIFDSSLNSTTSPTAFSKTLDASVGTIEGWTSGVVGMKLGGVRKITIPGRLAYGEKMEICGGYNKPLKFLVLAVAKEDPLASASSALDTAYLKLQYAYYGIDPEQISN